MKRTKSTATAEMATLLHKSNFCFRVGTRYLTNARFLSNPLEYRKSHALPKTMRHFARHSVIPGHQYQCQPKALCDFLRLNVTHLRSCTIFVVRLHACNARYCQGPKSVRPSDKCMLCNKTKETYIHIHIPRERPCFLVSDKKSGWWSDPW